MQLLFCLSKPVGDEGRTEESEQAKYGRAKTGGSSFRFRLLLALFFLLRSTNLERRNNERLLVV